MTTTDATASPPATRARWRLDATLLALASVLVRLPALVAGRHVTFDDGQYGATVLALRHGGEPFVDVFSSQGPLHQPLLYVFDLVGFRTLDAPRLLTVTAGGVATIATYAIGRRITSRGGALLAAALVASSGSVLYVTGPISGDGPGLALAVTAVALALAYRARPSSARAVGVGIAMGAALCVKTLVLPAAVPVALLLLAPRRYRDVAVAVGSAIAVGLATALPWGIDRVWDQSVAYHQDSHRVHSPLGNLAVLVQTLAERDPFVVAGVLASAAFLVWTRCRGSALPARRTIGGDRPYATTLLTSWLLAQLALAAYDPAMWRPHIVHVVTPLALLAALHPAPWRVLAALFVVLAPLWYSNVHNIVWPGGYPRDEQAIVDRLRHLPGDAVVISDDPGWAWRAHRRVPGNLVDVSMKRFQQHRLTTKVVARAAAARDVCAVIVWSRDRLGSLPSLPDRLRREGFRQVQRWGGVRAFYERPVCPA